ncbi:MAG: DUF2190 family protein [Alphaproteobacteria bacterium]
MATNKVQEGKTLTYSNSSGSAIASGDVVVVGEQIGVAVADIPDEASGVLAMEGVFNLPKVSGAVIAAGEEVIWDASAGAFDDNAATPATGDVSGCCVAWEGAGDGVTTIAVKLNVGPGVVA